MSRIITAALFLLAADYAYRAGYMAHRVDAVQPFWRLSRARTARTLRLVDELRDHAAVEQAFAYNQIAGVSGEPDNLSRGASLVLTPLAARRRVHGSKP